MNKKNKKTARYKNVGLATYGKNFGKSTSPNAAKVIQNLYKIVN